MGDGLCADKPSRYVTAVTYKSTQPSIPPG